MSMTASAKKPAGDAPLDLPSSPKGDGIQSRSEQEGKRSAANISRSEMCRRLALAGEQKCKDGDLVSGVEDLEAALKTGTQNLHLISTIYSQLGNAYFYLRDLKKAVECHKKDLSLSRILGDTSGEMKACSNLSSVFRQLEEYKEAISFARKRVELCRQLADKVEEVQAVYVLANHYHAQAKSVWTESESSPSVVTELLETSVVHYEACLALTEKVGGNEKLKGRVFGHLGNISYLLGKTKDAVKYHMVRLQLAQEQNDKAAVNRSYNNLGNAYLFGQNLDKAECCYLQMMDLSEELNDQASVSKALFGLATVFTLRRDHRQACNYYKQQLGVARVMKDSAGELQALFGLTTTYRTMGEFQEAYHYAREHQAAAEKANDRTAMQAAEMNVAALRMLVSRDGALIPTVEQGDLPPRPLVPIEPPDSRNVDLSFSESGSPHIHQLDSSPSSARQSVASSGSDVIVDVGSSRRSSSVERTPRSSQRSSSVERTSSRRGSLDSRSMSPLVLLRKPRCDSTQGSTSSLNSSPSSSPRLSTKQFQHQTMTSPLMSGSQDSQNRVSPDPAAGDVALTDDNVLNMLSRLQSSRLEDQRGVVGPKQSTLPRSVGKAPKKSGNHQRSFRLFSSRGSSHGKDLASGSSLSLPRSLPSSSPCRSDQQFQNGFAMSSSSDHASKPNTEVSDSDADMNDLFDCLELVQGRSIDDQRASLPTRSSTSSTEKRQTVV